MTTIGHALTGLAIGYLTIPDDMPRRPKLCALAIFAFIANIPDLPLGRYIISHSVFTVTIAIVAGVIYSKIVFRNSPYFTNRMLLGAALAWYSHLLLDTMYNRAGEQGYEMFWPLSDARAALPIPWLLQGDKVHILSWHNVSVAFFEILTFGGLLLAAVAMKRWRSSNSIASTCGEMPSA